MAVHFHPLRIKNIEKETADAVTIQFDVPEALAKDFQFLQGQNITLKTNIHGEEVRRSYSICNAPYENKLTVAIKKVEQGVFSTYANQSLKQGDVLEVMPPTGKFNTALNPAQTKKYVAFAAGSGITPILSIIKQTLHEEPNSFFTLVYSNKNRSSILFFEELEALKNKYLQRFQLIHLLSREQSDSALGFGRINAEKLNTLSKLIDYNRTDDFFCCGPEELIFSIKNYLEAAGVSEHKIHFELFASKQKQKSDISFADSAHKEATASITIQADGRSISFELGFNEGNILDAALKQGADLPYACKGGMCCTCKAKLLEGRVAMDVHWGLEHDEIEQGYILTCQAHPLQDKILIDFDTR
jgi:ring-1,2-phenylacetyl-CoA epoxidase subunit PaaE